MFKDKKDASTKGQDGLNCDEDLNTTENADNETIIIGRKVIAYFNDLTKHTSTKKKKVILNR